MSNKRRILVGVFIIIGVLLFGIGLFVIGSRDQLFKHHYYVYADLNKLDTLTAGGKVRVSGMDAGSISAIAVPKSASGQFRLKLQVDEQFRPIVRQDSLVSVATEGMVGNKYINIAKGEANAPPCQPGCTLPSEEPVEISDLIRQASGIAKNANATIEDLRAHSDQAIDHITKLVSHVDGTVEGSRGNVKTITTNAAHLSANANDIVSSVKQGKGAVGELLADKKTADEISETVANAKAASANADEATKKVDAMTAELDRAVSVFLKSNQPNGGTATTLRNTVEEADRAATNVAEDTAALKHNFFLRGFFNRRGFYNLDNLTPSKYADSEFVKKPKMRVWIPSPGLFTAEQKLTKDGEAIVKQQMAKLVPYLPNNPIVVEGYASEPKADQRYTASRERAIAVKNELESAFHIDPQYIGAIGFGDHPPKGAGREEWSGVCLVLVVSKK